jgi:hypothetical protein
MKFRVPMRGYNVNVNPNLGEGAALLPYVRVVKALTSRKADVLACNIVRTEQQVEQIDSQSVRTRDSVQGLDDL